MKTNSISAALAVHARIIATTRQLIFRRAILWTGFLAFATIALGPQPTQAAVTEAWVQRYGSEAGSYDSAYNVVTDAGGNVIVAGTTWHTQTGSGSDMRIIKYSGAGVPLWTNRYDKELDPMYPGPRHGDVAVDGSGNVFVTGYSGGDYATIAYSGAGVPLWTNRYNGPGNGSDYAHAVAVDGSGNVFVTGTAGFVYDGPLGDYATIAYSGAGVPLWTNRYGGPTNSYDQPTAVAVDASGNVFVTGNSGTIAYSGAGVPLWTNGYGGTAVVVDSSGNVFVMGGSRTIAYSGVGVPLWTNGYPSGYFGQATAIAVDGIGKVFVTGWSDSGDGNLAYATIAYSGAGVPLWTNRYNGPGNGEDRPQTKSSLAIGSDGAVYVTGVSDGDFATVKYVWRSEIAIQLLSTIPPTVNLTLSGAPNSSWAIERALEPTGPWTNLSALLIGTNGSAQFQDTNPPSPAGFYRARQ